VGHVGQARVRSGIPRSGSCDQDRTEGNQTEEQTAAGGAAPLRGGEVAGVEASTSLGGSGVARVG
jgi:hypothetical protein